MVASATSRCARPLPGDFAGALPGPAAQGLKKKTLFSLKGDNNYICLLIHYVCALISSEMEISNSELLPTKLPLSAREHLLTVTYKTGETSLPSVCVCSPGERERGGQPGFGRPCVGTCGAGGGRRLLRCVPLSLPPRVATWSAMDGHALQRVRTGAPVGPGSRRGPHRAPRGVVSRAPEFASAVPLGPVLGREAARRPGRSEPVVLTGQATQAPG